GHSCCTSTAERSLPGGWRVEPSTSRQDVSGTSARSTSSSHSWRTFSLPAAGPHPATPVARRDHDRHWPTAYHRGPVIGGTPMRLQLTVFSIALLCVPVASAAQPSGQPASLTRVLGQLQDIRAARASNPTKGKISSRLVPPAAV